MTTTILKRSDIVEKSALIEWLSQTVKRREPQRQVPIPFVKNFDYLVRQLKKDDVMVVAWLEYLHELFCSIIDNDEPQLCNEDITAVIAGTLDRAVKNQGKVSAADFVASLVELAELDGLKMNRADKALKITSTRRFFANHGFNVAVTLPKR
ncbi:hypothetical protein CK218_12505 [Mesorhizobium sp. WSM3879]|uniref:hypothetical protein n=1 Tax=Mesorhizobium sp. WSM3879 TaxID=2029406 RepID=UPI000BB0C95B|nr:hypothetical protein [Mesorhizobium sp. WSM3879]PBB81184.1 hypothetical protein CK218_12505 [Mesorhizobium sp. WSM3879]